MIALSVGEWLDGYHIMHNDNNTADGAPCDNMPQPKAGCGGFLDWFGRPFSLCCVDSGGSELILKGLGGGQRSGSRVFCRGGTARMSKMPGAEVARPNRDRFVGFAFAGAHLLLETDNVGRILFAAGARCGLVTGTLDDMINHSLFEYFPKEEHSLLRMLLQRLIQKGKLDVTHIVMKSAAARPFSAFLGACRLPNHPNRCFLRCATRARNASGGRTHLGTCWLSPVADGWFGWETGRIRAP